ncbi:hypothetical protein MAPG_11738 [Magnaporthiopsis poae ATCC 64411]|uniref:Uncharacterized protein n=1 Tax=Magnaporthiopsis poae (strain ATCC 64411 / 73-15) TaxID=644358 RepID=A0A0C4EG24_MAGP6|nr:hypothetical protein MAPG_11738 [Magnaporthiopsis poae ATCC 64411]
MSDDANSHGGESRPRSPPADLQKMAAGLEMIIRELGRFAKHQHQSVSRQKLASILQPMFDDLRSSIDQELKEMEVRITQNVANAIIARTLDIPVHSVGDRRHASGTEHGGAVDEQQ